MVLALLHRRANYIHWPEDLVGSDIWPTYQDMEA